VNRVWRHFGIQPHRVRGYVASDDPEFEETAAEIIGLYLKPPVKAAVFCVDEKSAIQALDRFDPVLPLSPGRAEWHGFEYFRHGTLSLYAALNTRTGDVIGKTAARHTSAEFVDFLGQVVASQPESREIHVVADNLSAHKTKNVFEFLQANPTVRIHYTPTYSSWLNQVEIWFSKIQRDDISRGIFTSTTDLSRKLIRVTLSRTTKPPHPSTEDLRMLLIALNQSLNEPLTQCTSLDQRSLHDLNLVRSYIYYDIAVASVIRIRLSWLMPSRHAKRLNLRTVAFSSFFR
jgi:transposase